jgi:hypothetical protein
MSDTSIDWPLGVNRLLFYFRKADRADEFTDSDSATDLRPSPPEASYWFRRKPRLRSRSRGNVIIRFFPDDARRQPCVWPYGCCTAIQTDIPRSNIVTNARRMRRIRLPPFSGSSINEGRAVSEERDQYPHVTPDRPDNQGNPSGKEKALMLPLRLALIPMCWFHPPSSQRGSSALPLS